MDSLLNSISKIPRRIRSAAAGNGAYVFSGARRSRRFNLNLGERLPLLERLENIWTVKRPKGRAPLNTCNGAAGFRFCATVRALFAIALLGSCASVQAQWLTQSFDLKAGWNAIYTHVDASHTTLDALIAGSADNPIEEVWLWAPAASVAQFISSPLEPSGAGTPWVSWKRATGPAGLKLIGNSAYLVKVRPQTASFTWNVLGKPVQPRYSWNTRGLNFLGFPTLPVNAPNFEAFFSASPELSLRAEIFRYPGGELGPNNPAPVTLTKRTTIVRRGEAFWLRSANYFNRYFGPFEIEGQSSSGIDFGDSRGQHRIRIRNLTRNSLEVRFSLVDSEAPPTGQRPIIGRPPLIARGAIDLRTLLYGYTALTAQQTLTLKPVGQAGSEAEIHLGLKRSAMTGDAGDFFAGILRFTDSLGFSQIDVPVAAEVGSTAGLWVGAAMVDQVRSYLKSYQKDASGQLAMNGDGTYVSSGVNTNLGPVARPFPLRVIIHKDSAGSSKLLQRVYYGNNTSNQAVIATLEARLDPKQLASARRVSAPQLPFSSGNLPWTMTGNLSIGGALAATVSLAHSDQASNPFLHAYHPDHDGLNETFSSVRARGEESFDVERRIELTFTPPATDDFASATAGIGTLSGRYSETLTFLGKGNESRQFQTQGAVVLNRVSAIRSLITD